jgi:hypothetical protein
VLPFALWACQYIRALPGDEQFFYANPCRDIGVFAAFSNSRIASQSRLWTNGN